MKVGHGVLVWNNGNTFDVRLLLNFANQQGNWDNGQKGFGKIFESASGRVIDGDFSDDEIREEYLHPQVRACVEKKVCTFSFTQQKSYLQYLWQTDDKGDR